MHSSSEQSPSPRKVLQLQGPRPTPLRISRESHKIKKPPLAPAAGPSHSPLPPEQQPSRAPVIIYSVSPKVIHTDPNDFMMVVQRLTGASPTSLSAANLPPPPAASPPGSLSPAARLAAIEGTRSSPGADRPAPAAFEVVDELGFGGDAEMGTAVAPPGILSPMPSSLPWISPSFFPSPVGDPGNAMAFLNDLSPVFRGSSFLPSPSSFLSTPTVPSPGAYWDIFGQL